MSFEDYFNEEQRQVEKLKELYGISDSYIQKVIEYHGRIPTEEEAKKHYQRIVERNERRRIKNENYIKRQDN